MGEWFGVSQGDDPPEYDPSDEPLWVWCASCRLHFRRDRPHVHGQRRQPRKETDV